MTETLKYTFAICDDIRCVPECQTLELTNEHVFYPCDMAQLYVPRREKTCLTPYQKQPAQLQRLARILKVCFSMFGYDNSNKRITKALIRLRGCAGWSVPLLFANTEDRISRVDPHMIHSTIWYGMTRSVFHCCNSACN